MQEARGHLGPACSVLVGGENSHIMQETWVCLGWEDPLQKGKAGLENSMEFYCIVHGVANKHH